MRKLLVLLSVITSFLFSLFLSFSQTSTGADPFAFFKPSVTIGPGDRAQLDSGHPITHVLQGTDAEVGLVAAIPVNADGDRLVAWVNRIEEWKKNERVLAVGRFSDPPRIEDLDGLELDDHDLAAIRSCRPGSCELKLSADEMTQLQHASTQAGEGSSSALQRAFRQMILERVQNYLKTGQIPPNEDHHKKVLPAARFESLLEHTPFLMHGVPKLAEGLRDHPIAGDPEDDWFLYWSKERLARKAMVSVTQVTIVRNNAPGLPDAMAVDKDIFSSHYINASLSVTALMRGDSEKSNYLVYVNRTEVDVLHGMFEHMVRWEINHRMKDASGVLEQFRRRLESGPPPELQSSPSARGQ
jgi:hypothetical protein